MLPGGSESSSCDRGSALSTFYPSAKPVTRPDGTAIFVHQLNRESDVL